MDRQREDASAQQGAGSPIEAGIRQRRRIIKRAALWGVPVILTLHGTAFAKHKHKTTQTSGTLSGNVSTPP